MAKKISMQDVANHVGVSKVTVSKALRGNEDISAAMSEKVRKAAAEIGYVYNVTGKMLRENLTYSIGVITSERYFGLDDYFYISLYKFLSADLEKIHYSAILHILDETSEQNVTIPGMITEQKVDGVIILGQLSKEYITKIVALNCPMVFLDFYYDRFDVDSINTDNFFGTYEITNTLIEKGHRNIAFVGNLNLTSSIQDRYLGYCKSMLEYKLPMKNEWIVSDRTDESKWIDIKLPKDMPSAFVCNCDKTAKNLITKLQKVGLKVPDDCSVVGFDDSIHAMQVEPNITTVRVNLNEMAKVAVKTITRRISNEVSNYGRVLIKGDVIIRDSVKSIEN
jgi:LacI family transcriptional regulator